jgi:predicted transcriptional regulator
MKNKNVKYGEILNKAEQYEKLQEGLSELIKESKVFGIVELCKHANLSTVTYYKALNSNSFNSEQMVRIFKAIIEVQNIYNTLQQNLPHLLEILNVKNSELIDKIGMSEIRFFNGLSQKNFNTTDLHKIFTTIMKLNNSK